VGSNSLEEFLVTHRKELACDAVVVSDTGMPSLKSPALTYALRGLIAFEVKLEGPKQDLHSGLFGGVVDNPAMALCQLLGQLRDKKGHVTIPGFYEGVSKVTAFEKKQFGRLPLKDSDYKKMTGVPALFGESGFTVQERRGARPTAEINGLTSGYQGEGNKTIIPAWASAKLTFRLVPDQDPEVIRKHVVRHLKKICPPTVRMTIKTGHGGEPYFISPTSPMAKAALETLQEASGREPLAIRDGGSIPIVTQFKKCLKAETLLLGVSLPDDGAHSPNEKFSLECFDLGLRMSALLWPKLSKTA
jgi:acetylornithine deacetylase/succinyl-diaminopimelate desuccinylase-like protein